MAKANAILYLSRHRWILVSVLIWLITGTSIAQPDWPLQKRGFQLWVSEWWTIADQHFNGTGDVVDNVAEYGYFITAYALRYGISDRFALSMKYPFANYVYTKLPLSGSKSSGWKGGDMEVGIQYTLLRKTNLSLTTQLDFSHPTSGQIGSQPTGDPASYQHLSLSLIRKSSIFHRHGWWQVSTGYRIRNADFDNEYYYQIGTGIAIDSNFTASIRLHGFIPIGDNEVTTGVFSESLFSNHRAAHMLSPAIRFRISKAISLGVGIDAMLGGKNRFADTGYEVGFLFKY
jgi:hypothetical protein